MWEVLLNKQKESEAMSAGKYSYKNAAIRICVDVLQEGRIEGSIHTPYCAEKVQFRDVMTLFMEERAGKHKQSQRTIVLLYLKSFCVS